MIIEEISIFVIAITIDMLLGEVPNKIHPVIYMGKMISKLKNYLPSTKISGLLITITTLFSFTILTIILLLIISYVNTIAYIIIAALIFSTTFSIKFLIESVQKIQKDLTVNINKARKSMSYLVSRDTSNLNESEITSAAIETLSENITDSIISPLFYMAIFSIFTFGVPAAVFYRVSNTQDAMLGYKTKELKEVGYVPALLDDILNYIPARITGFYVVLASFILKYDYKQSYHIMREDALKTPSPNSGYSMAATAGALNITLTKKGVYQLGSGKDQLTQEKIYKAIKITKVTAILFIITIVIIYLLIYIILIL